MVKRPAPVRPLRKQERAYAAAIQRDVLGPLQAQVINNLRKANRTMGGFRNAIDQAFASLPADLGEAEATAAMEGLRKYSRERTIQTFRAAFGVNVGAEMSELMLRPFMQQKIGENVGLIKNIPEKMARQINEGMQDIFQTKGFDQEALVKMLEQRFEVGSSRAKLIARDQTEKTIGNLTQERNTQMGVTEYIWQTSGDERVRPSHAALDGTTQRWDSPPPETGHPGEDINCRCVAIPKVPEGLVT